jgi:hypothetical protein
MVMNSKEKALLLVSIGCLVACSAETPDVADWSASTQGALKTQSALKKPLPPQSGRDVFRHATYGDEQFWTGKLQMHKVISTGVSPQTALAVGLKVDADAVPPGVLASADLSNPATTVALIGLNAVVGIEGKVVDGTLTEVGITCALCHSTVDDSVAHGIGHRLDGWPNRDLNAGRIISLSPALTAAQRAVYQSWGPGRFDPRFNVDGISDPVVIPPAYGLSGVPAETYTGDGPISYWNAYVATLEMGGKGTFSDPRIGVSVASSPDLVTPRLPALLAYQLTLTAPPPPSGSFNSAAATRGRVVFNGAGRCATCHQGTLYTQATLHSATETGMASLYATRSATRLYRTTPLRGLWQHPPYFHDGSAATLADVVEHYDARADAQRLTEERSGRVSLVSLTRC